MDEDMFQNNCPTFGLSPDMAAFAVYPVNLPLSDVPLSRSFMRLSVAVPRASFSQTASD